jgi:uncharacterized protein
LNLISKIKYKLANTPELIIDGEIVPVGVPHLLRINAGKLPSDNRINVFAHVFHTGKPGPSVLIMGGVHGNEINGIEIVRRIVVDKTIFSITAGTLIVIPLLNVYGFINFSRDVAEGKDLNRSFPGHLNGSLASRVARIITKKILPHVDLAIDLHTGGEARYNYPQMRYTKQDLMAAELAKASGLKYLIESAAISNSFRKSAKDMNVPAVVFESGESIRLDKTSLDQGSLAIKNILNQLGMYPQHKYTVVGEQFVIKKDSWIRADVPGMFIWYKKSGDFIHIGDVLGEINDPYGTKSYSVVANTTGHIIGHNNASVVTLGDALFHIGTIFENQKNINLSVPEEDGIESETKQYHLGVNNEESQMSDSADESEGLD